MFLKNKKALTLIELLAVIAIIAILFVLLIPQISKAIDKSRETGVMTDFRSYEIGLKNYFMESTESLSINTVRDSLNGFLDKQLLSTTTFAIKNDPFGEPYIIYYHSPKLLEVASFDSEKKVKRYSLFVRKNGDEIESNTNGFSTNIKSDNWFGSNDNYDFVHLNDNELIITSYKGSSSSVSVPSSINDKTVVGIGHQSFSKNGVFSMNKGATLTSVTIPNTVKFISNSAFTLNEISSLTLSDNLKVIENFAFSQNKLSTVTIPSSVLFIGKGAFNMVGLTSYKLLGSPILNENSLTPSANPLP